MSDETPDIAIGLFGPPKGERPEAEQETPEPKPDEGIDLFRVPTPAEKDRADREFLAALHPPTKGGDDAD